MQDKDYKILEAQFRKNWSGNLGEMSDYAVKLEGVEDWVQLTQKPDSPAPQPGQTLHGHTEVQTRGGNSYLKFKKVNPNFTGSSGGSSAMGKLLDADYMVKLLEAIAKEVGAESAVRTRDVVDETIDDEPIDLAQIPF